MSESWGRVWIDFYDETVTSGAIIGKVYATDLGDVEYIRADIAAAERNRAEAAEDEVAGLRAKAEAAEELAEVCDAMIDFHNGPAEAKRPDIWQRLLQRFAAALTAYKETGK